MSSEMLSPMLNTPELTNATVVHRFLNTMFDHKDFRTRTWFLSGSPWPVFTIVGIYLIFCLYVGPRYMRKRKPFELKNTLMIYNAVQVTLSCVMCYETYKGGWNGHYDYRCAPLHYGTDPVSMRMARVVWLYYIAKITELLDTVFFVLRKKDRQISFLHLYHHASMPLLSLVAVKRYAAGHGTIIVMINSFIHVIMYSYYLLAALGPKVQKYLWWKNYITLLQILQFMIIFVHTFQIQFQTDCNFPKFCAALLSINAGFFIYMFSSFYIKSYKKDKKPSTETVHKQD